MGFISTATRNSISGSPGPAHDSPASTPTRCFGLPIKRVSGKTWHRNAVGSSSSLPRIRWTDQRSPAFVACMIAVGDRAGALQCARVYEEQMRERVGAAPGSVRARGDRATASKHAESCRRRPVDTG